MRPDPTARSSRATPRGPVADGGVAGSGARATYGPPPGTRRRTAPAAALAGALLLPLLLLHDRGGLARAGPDTPGRARAAPSPSPSPSTGRPAPPGDAERARARSLYAAAAREYAAARYDKAIDLFLRAYAISRAPAILFNVGQAYRLEGRAFCDDALTYYRRALDEEPGAENRPEIEDRIEEMSRCAREEAAAHVRRPDDDASGASAVTARPARRHRSFWALGTMTAGGVAAATGVLIYWRARARFDEVEPDCPCPDGTFSGWETATTASYALMAAGALAAGAGLVWWWRGSPVGDEPRAGLAPSAGGLQWAGTF